MDVLILPHRQSVEDDQYALGHNLCKHLHNYFQITALTRTEPNHNPEYEVIATNSSSSIKHFHRTRSYLKSHANEYDVIQASVPYKHLSPVATIDTETPIVYAPLEEGHDIPYDHFKDVLLDKLLGIELPDSLAKPVYKTVSGAKKFADPLREQMYAEQLKQANHLVAVTEHTERVLKQLTDGETPTSRIPLGVRVEDFPYSPEERDGYFVYFGRLTERKNVSTLIRAMNQIEETTHLHICGEGPTREKLESLADKLGVDEDVTFHGYTPQEKLVELIQGAEASLHPSTSDSFYSTRVEALSCGTPIIGSDLPICDELHRPEISTVMTQNTPEEYAATMDGYIRNDHNKNSEFCRYVANQYSWDVVSDRYMVLLYRIQFQNPDVSW